MEKIPKIRPDDDAAINLTIRLNHLQKSGLPKVYIIIDEYDNFANQLITTHQDDLYQEITSGDSFLWTYFKVIKEGRQTGAINNFFITGVLPITLDDLTSSFNIAKYITLNPVFEQMLGFTQTEVNTLLDEIYQDYNIDPSSRGLVQEVIKNQYNGYHFVQTSQEALYYSTMLMYFLDRFCEQKTIPEDLIDLNLRTDLAWIKRLTGGQPKNIEEFISQLTTQQTIPYNRKALVSQFRMDEFFEPEFYPISLFYLGILKKRMNSICNFQTLL
jgi:hypothetical protein